MKPQRLNYFFWQSLLLTTSVVVFTIKPLRVIALPFIASEIPASNQQLLPGQTITKSVASIREIRSLNQIEHPLTDAQKLVQSPTPTDQTEVTLVTGVKVNSTDKGLEVILETSSKSDQLQVTPKTEGNSYIADIPNTQLRLTSGESFRQEKPAVGITEVTVTNTDANSIQVTVTGEVGAPAVKLFDSNEGLVFGVTSTTSTTQAAPSGETTSPTQQQQTTPELKPKPTEEQPIELVVIGTPETSYQDSNASVGTRTETPIRDIPASIQVVPRQVLQDQGSFRVQDAVRNVGGQPGTNFGRSGETFILRGFTQSNNYLRNGVRDAKAISGIVIPTTNIERIEVLRGPASVLYGFGDPGGTINIVTKQPLSEPYYAFEFAGGGFDFYQPAIDLSGPLTDDKKLLYRLNASYYNADGSTDLFRKEYYFVSPVISWQIGKNTNLTFEADYTDLRLRELWGQPAEGTVLPNRNGKIPRDRSIIEPTDFSNRRTARIGYRFKHSFSENWSLSNAFQAWIWRQEQYNTTATRLRPDGRTLERTTQINASSTDAINGGTTNWSIFTLDTNVVGKFQTGGIQHQLLMGFDLYKDVQGPFARIFRATEPIDLYDPVYGKPLGRVTSATNAKTRLDNLGLYVQDQIALTDNLKLVLGGRYDLSTSIITDYVASSVFTQPDEAFSPQVGVVYQPSKTVSLYANYNRSFLQITGTTAFSGSRAADGSFFTPQRGTQYEVGIKTDFLDGKLSTNLALYEVTLSNVLTIDPSNPRLSVQVGEQQSQGIEFNVAGEILPGWNIIAAYAYTDAKVSKDINRSRIGNRLPNVPENGFSLWTTYTISQRELKGLGFGLGLLYVGERQGDLLNSFQLPSYLRTDAAVFYRNKKFRLGVNFKNLFNIDYVDIGGSSLSIFRGDPFNAVVTLDWQF